MKKYKIKVTPVLKKKLNRYLRSVQQIENEYRQKVTELEKKMSKDTGIEDIEFFFGELGFEGVHGVGNVSRTMPLVNKER